MSTQPSQSAVLFLPSLLWCTVVYRLHLCGPDNAVSLIILCQKRALIMGRYPHWPLLLLTLSLHISLRLTSSLLNHHSVKSWMTNKALWCGILIQNIKYSDFFHSFMSMVFLMFENHQLWVSITTSTRLTSEPIYLSMTGLFQNNACITESPNLGYHLQSLFVFGVHKVLLLFWLN